MHICTGFNLLNNKQIQLPNTSCLDRVRFLLSPVPLGFTAGFRGKIEGTELGLSLLRLLYPKTTSRRFSSKQSGVKCSEHTYELKGLHGSSR